MNKESAKTRLKGEFRRLFRAMDFVSDRYLARKRRPAKLAGSFYEVYQQLGVAWEFLGLQCRHWDGYRKVRDGKLACRICGRIKGTKEQWVLLPAKGPKVVGQKTRPNSVKVFADKKAATLIEDRLQFHGATLRVSVTNRYQSHLFRGKPEITVAEERMVRLLEDAIECSMSTHRIQVKLPPKRAKGQRPPYGAFVGELPKQMLRKFPVMLEYDAADRLRGVLLFRLVEHRHDRKPAARK